MNGDLLTVVLTVIGTGVALLGASGGLFWKLGNIESDVKNLKGDVEALASVWNHISSNENRLTKIETEHKCCPVCNRDKGGE